MQVRFNFLAGYPASVKSRIPDIQPDTRICLCKFFNVFKLGFGIWDWPLEKNEKEGVGEKMKRGQKKRGKSHKIC